MAYCLPFYIIYDNHPKRFPYLFVISSRIEMHKFEPACSRCNKTDSNRCGVAFAIVRQLRGVQGPHNAATAPIDDADLPDLAEAATRLDVIAAAVEGAFVECKRQSVTLHLRATTTEDRRRAESRFHDDTRDLLARQRLRLQPGHTLSISS